MGRRRLCWITTLLVVATEVRSWTSCYLQPVHKGEISAAVEVIDDGPSVFVAVGTPFKNATVARLLQGGACVLAVTFNGATNPPDCVTIPNGSSLAVFIYEEVMQLVLRRRQGRLLLHSDLPAVEAELGVPGVAGPLFFTTDGVINVAFDCPDGCFQFERATIRKEIFMSRGRALNHLFLYALANSDVASESSHLEIHQHYNGSTDQHHLVDLQASPIGRSNFSEFDITINFQRSDVCDDGLLLLHMSATQDSGAATNLTSEAVCVPSQDLILGFHRTRGILWSLCPPPPVHTDTFAVAHACSLTTNSASEWLVASVAVLLATTALLLVMVLVLVKCRFGLPTQ